MSDDAAALAKGGRTNFFGFLLRLAGRIPFLFIAGRLYGADATGRFAYAIMIVELVAALATLGLKRGLAAELARSDRPQAHVVADAQVLAWGGALLGAAVLIALPFLVFPNHAITGADRWFPLVALAIVACDIPLAALAFRHDVAATVRARSLIEPWTLTLAAGGLAFTVLKEDGLILAYAASLVAAMAASLIPCWRSYGLPRRWFPHPERLVTMARTNLPLAGADVADWGSRRLDIFILGRFASAEIVGIYYVAQQLASLPQKLKTSFDPILGPVLTTRLAAGDHAAAAAQIAQVGFWVLAAQLGVVLALGIPGRAMMGLFGPAFAAGAAVMATLLVAELLASQAAVAESGLIYTRRLTNLWWSLGGIALQAALTIVLAQNFGGVGAALGLAAAMLFLSIAKTRILSKTLATPVAGWRWALPLAALPAAAVGIVMLGTPEWAQLSIGIAAILGVYGAVIWTIGFKGPDRLLFTRR